MKVPINRRRFLKSSLGTTAAAFTIPLMDSPAEGQLSNVINFAILSHPALATLALFEAGFAMLDQAGTKAQLSDLSQELTGIARRQDRILDMLAQQRIIMREELRHGFLENDSRDLIAATQEFGVALAVNDRKNLDSVASQMNHLAFKIPTYGLAAAPAYLTAISLQNAAHYALKSESRQFLEINRRHHENLEIMLYGEGPESLPYLAEHTFVPKHLNGSASPAPNLLTNFGRSYAFALMSIRYEISDYSQPQPTSSYEYGFEYEGFRNGQPIFEPVTTREEYGKFKGVRGYGLDVRGKKAVSANIWFGAINENGINQSAIDYRNIPGLLPEPTAGLFGSSPPEFELQFNSQGQLVGSNAIIKRQLMALADYYMKAYDPSMGDITNARLKDVKKGQQDMGALLSTGLRLVDQIMEKVQAVSL